MLRELERGIIEEHNENPERRGRSEETIEALNTSENDNDNKFTCKEGEEEENREENKKRGRK